MFRLVSVFIFFVLTSLSVPVLAGDFVGNKMLEILGEDKNGEAFKKFKTQYILDKALKNPELGIKLTAAHDSISVITSVTIFASGTEMNDIKYKQFDGALPFDIAFNDDEASLSEKLGIGKGSSEDSKLKFKKDGITINIFFKSAAKKKISYIKFSQVLGMVEPYRMGGNHEVPVVKTPPLEASVKPSIPVKAKTSAKPEVTPNKTVPELPSGAEFGKVNNNGKKASKSEFYNAVMSVIESGEEEMFKDIKKAALKKGNFWNYKYTYATGVSIPGEKYNMIYSFPFQSSQLDFVSVLEEADGSNILPIQSKYAEVEAKLKEDFKLQEGWSYHYTANQEDPKGLKDFEVKNSKLGSIVLDYSTNPSGKHVLYMRFLLQYN
jgi:hypothetical protein